MFETTNFPIIRKKKRKKTRIPTQMKRPPKKTTKKKTDSDPTSPPKNSWVTQKVSLDLANRKSSPQQRSGTHSAGRAGGSSRETPPVSRKPREFQGEFQGDLMNQKEPSG